jgi:hypothetical protein
MNIPNWFFAGLLILLTILLFFKCRRGVSYFSSPRVPFTGTNTIFAMNEFDWIPSEVKDLLRDRINVDVIPALRTMTQRSWNSVSDKTLALEELDNFFKKFVDEINKANITLSTGSPSP